MVKINYKKKVLEKYPNAYRFRKDNNIWWIYSDKPINYPIIIGRGNTPGLAWENAYNENCKNAEKCD